MTCCSSSGIRHSLPCSFPLLPPSLVCHTKCWSSLAYGIFVDMYLAVVAHYMIVLPSRELLFLLLLSQCLNDIISSPLLRENSPNLLSWVAGFVNLNRICPTIACKKPYFPVNRGSVISLRAICLILRRNSRGFLFPLDIQKECSL